MIKMVNRIENPKSVLFEVRDNLIVTFIPLVQPDWCVDKIKNIFMSCVIHQIAEYLEIRSHKAGFL